MHQFSQKLIQFGALAVCCSSLVIIGFFANRVTALSDNELYGYACNIPTGLGGQNSGNNIGCISLSKVSATGVYAANTTHQVFFTRSSQVTPGPTLGEFSGTGYNPRVGEIKFGEPCPNEPGFTTAMKTGKQCAKLLDIGGITTSADPENTGWGKFIYVGNITHTLGSEKLAGIGWQVYNTDGINIVSDVGVGILNFATAYWTKLGCTQSSATNYNPNATVNDNSCNFPSVCGGANGVVYPTSTSITGTGSGSMDLCGVNSTNIGTFASTNPSATTGTFTWDCKSITPSVPATSCSATWDTSTTGGGGTGGGGTGGGGTGGGTGGGGTGGGGTGTPNKPINPGFKET